MQAVVYYLSLPIIYLISILPFWWLYRLSDLIFLIVYKLFRYRRTVVMTNLQNSFPEKSDDELRRIERDFYGFFCDLIVETVKTLTISRAAGRKRVSFKNVDILHDYYSAHQSVLFAMGHFGNWEMGGVRLAAEPGHKLYVIYHPLRNKYFERLIYHMRTRLGNGLYPMRETFACIERDKEDITATAFIADQIPPRKNMYWLQFLNQDTAFFTGLGRAAVKTRYPVVFVTIKRPRRGYYEISLHDLVPDPHQTDSKSIVKLFADRLEQDIRDSPELWLWTHRRWKRKRN